MKDLIQERLHDNLDRVESLVGVYETFLAGQGRGRRGHSKTDVLRAASVLLHASLEDFVRSIEYWRLPAAVPVALDRIPFQSRGKRFALGDLAPHRGKLVDVLIEESVKAHLERSNYNNVEDLAQTLEHLEFSFSPIKCFDEPTAPNRASR